jgi:hypothetical protein
MTEPIERTEGGEPQAVGVTRWRVRNAAVEAIQWTGSNADELAAFAGAHFAVVPQCDRVGDSDLTAELFTTAHNVWRGLWDGDWAVRGIKGEFFAVRARDFAATYEAVTAAEDDFPWPPWLENLSDRDRIHAIVAAVATCYQSDHRRDTEAPHCTVMMAGRFLGKMLAAGAEDRTSDDSTPGMFESVYNSLLHFMDEALGTEEQDGADAGLEADVRLLATQRDEARSRLAELENAITWGTSCTSCARVLDSANVERERAERADEKLIDVVALIGQFEREAEEMRAQAVQNGLHPALAGGHREANLLRQCAARLSAAAGQEHPSDDVFLDDEGRPTDA